MSTADMKANDTSLEIKREVTVTIPTHHVAFAMCQDKQPDSIFACFLNSIARFDHSGFFVDCAGVPGESRVLSEGSSIDSAISMMTDDAQDMILFMARRIKIGGRKINDKESCTFASVDVVGLEDLEDEE